jgi:thiosulfate/3-mercaptopyruvate sulfurtransferase
MEEAHMGVHSNPSEDPERYCGGCHADVVSKHATSLHKTQQGYFTFFSLRFQGTPDGPYPTEFVEGFNGECGECHASCGQCHVSVPKTARGGLVKAHRFNRVPDMTKNCTACHGSRIGDEYLGNNADAVPGVKADVHWVPNFKTCDFCHSGQEMHGDGTEYEYKLQVQNMPACEDCHEKGLNNLYHNAHWGKLSCSTCHSQVYRNCNSCHVDGDGIEGDPYFLFKIGKNSNPQDRTYEWVTLRHIPIANDTYANWGANIGNLPNYDIMPTWKYTMPHNMQKNTAQTEPDTSANIPCAGSCHTNEAIFLRPADLDPNEVMANDPVVVKDNEWPVGP